MRQRIASEISRLRKEEAEVVASVEAALAKENMDKEGNVAGVSRETVQQDVDDIMGRISHNKTHRDTLMHLVGDSRSQLLSCLKEHQQRTLECAPEVSAFRTAIQTVEKVSDAPFQSSRGLNLAHVALDLQEFIASV